MLAPPAAVAQGRGQEWDRAAISAMVLETLTENAASYFSRLWVRPASYSFAPAEAGAQFLAKFWVPASAGTNAGNSHAYLLKHRTIGCRFESDSERDCPGS